MDGLALSNDRSWLSEEVRSEHVVEDILAKRFKEWPKDSERTQDCGVLDYNQIDFSMLLVFGKVQLLGRLDRRLEMTPSILNQ